jgi:hypothetical protein
MPENGPDSADANEDGWVEEIQAGAQTIYPPRSPDDRDTFQSWDEIIGNDEVKATLRAAVRKPGGRNHILAYGANRSGKTWSIHLALQATFCRALGENLNPCQTCDSCRRWNSGFNRRDGRYYNGKRSFYYYGVDGQNPTTFDEKLITGYTDSECPMILYIDEVASAKITSYLPQLLKPMQEGILTVLASGVRIKPEKDPKTGKTKPGVLADFRYRFPNIVKTSPTSRPQFLAWLRKECELRSLHPDDETLNEIATQAKLIPGQAQRPLKRASFLEVPLTLEFVKGFRWDAE